MSLIYQHARQTNIWLGHRTPEVENSFGAIKEARKLFPSLSAFELKGTVESIQKGTGLDFSRILGHLSRTFDWIPVSALLQRPWFRRKWVLQEVVMSENAVLLCGDDKLSWAILEDLMIYIWGFQLTIISENADSNPNVGAGSGNINAMATARHRKGGQPVFDLLTRAREFQCTDPRDHLYALLGMASDITEGPNRITPDYNITSDQVYRQLAAWCATVKGSLEFLSCGYEHILDERSFPSWVPDISKPNRETILSPRMHYCASRQTAPRLMLSQDQSTLTLGGIVIDELEVLGQPFTYASTRFPPVVAGTDRPGINYSTDHYLDQMAWSKQMMQECLAIASDLPGRTMSSERFEQFWRTMLWDLDGNMESPSAETGAIFKKLLLDLSTIFDDHDKEWGKSFIFTSQAIEPLFTAFYEDRRFSSTANGHLGCVPKRARLGDKLCIFHGGKTPYVIRPCENGQYQYIGICYLHGFMHGEALDLGIEIQDIALV